MFQESSDRSPEGLVIRPSTDLVTLPDGSSPALSEMISRSLEHIRQSRALVVTELRAGEEREFEIAAGVKIVMCWIPPGEFLMGSPEDEVGRMDNEVQHRVILTQGYWLGKYLVTQGQWEAVMGNNPSYFNGYNLPVENISWDDISGHGGFIERANRFAALGGIFSLPTEAQWEYACRAGTTTALNSGKNLTTKAGACPNLNEVAWYNENSGDETHPVGQKKANGWGLYDMHGNVWEWCVDGYEGYTGEPLVDPRGPLLGSNRVIRGGSWYEEGANDCRVAVRYSDDAANSDYNLGFRMARSSLPVEPARRGAAE